MLGLVYLPDAAGYLSWERSREIWMLMFIKKVIKEQDYEWSPDLDQCSRGCGHLIQIKPLDNTCLIQRLLTRAGGKDACERACFRSLTNASMWPTFGPDTNPKTTRLSRITAEAGGESQGSQSYGPGLGGTSAGLF